MPSLTRPAFLLPVVAGGAAVAVVLGIAAVSAVRSDSAGSGGGSSLQPLRIGSYAVGAAGTAATDGSSGRYVLAGTLPARPTRGTVWRLSRISDASETVQKLADALGVHGSVTHDKQGWTIRDGSAQVRVYDADGSPWGYASDVKLWGMCAPIPPEGYRTDGGVSSGCAVDGVNAGSGSDADVRAAADPILAAAGLTGSAAAPLGDGPWRTISVDPTVDGLATGGYSTTLNLQSTKTKTEVVTAGGWLAPTQHALKSVGSYPLRSAKDAFDGLNSLAIPAIGAPEIACVPESDCGLNKPVNVTGATYGLMPAWEDGSHALLVPAWYFTTSGAYGSISQGALDPAYVKNPVQPDNPATTPGSSGGGSSPGSRGNGASAAPPPPAARG